MSLSWIALVVYFKMIQGLTIPLILYAGLFPCWAMFFVIGVALGQKQNRDYKIWIPAVITIVGLVLSMIETNYLYTGYGNGVGIKVSAFVYSCGAVVLLLSLSAERLFAKCGFLYKAIIYVGNISFGVYLIHCYLIRLVKHIDIHSWALRLIITLVLTVVVIVILRKLIPMKYHKYFGV